MGINLSNPSIAANAVLALFLVAKLTINVSFMIIYPYAGELYPTEVRALGFALGSYIGFLGTIPIPFIVHLVCEMPNNLQGSHKKLIAFKLFFLNLLLHKQMKLK